MSRKKLWLTYAWKNNEDNDVDFVVQELGAAGLDVRFDRRNLIPGQRLWTQIGGAITDPAMCDAWGIILTANSLVSEACIEELSYALNRALDAKGEAFPPISSMTLPFNNVIDQNGCRQVVREESIFLREARKSRTRQNSDYFLVSASSRRVTASASGCRPAPRNMAA